MQIIGPCNFIYEVFEKFIIDWLVCVVVLLHFIMYICTWEPW